MTKQPDGSTQTPTSPTRIYASSTDRGMQVISYLIGGVLVYGGAGWLGDHLLGTAFLLPIGIVVGAAFGVYVIIRTFGQVPADEAVPSRTERFRSTLARRSAVRTSNQKVGLP